MTIRNRGKGRGISINEPNMGGTSDVNAFKMRIEAQTLAPPPVREFRPLKVQIHPRQAEMLAYAEIPSRYADG